jgi:hypothetical protein
MTEGLTRREKYEDQYRKLWLEQLKIDRVGNPLAREPTPQQKNGQRTGKFGKMGGRKLKLTKQAEVINQMLKKRLPMRDIADILNITMELVVATKDRFDLPRAEETNVDAQKELDEIEWDDPQDPRIEGILRQIRDYEDKLNEGENYEPNF